MTTAPPRRSIRCPRTSPPIIAWASDPKQVQRKQAGVGVLVFLFLFAGLTYVSYRRIWKGVAH